MTEPRVSAIITAYNSEAFIADAIASVLHQSRPVDEILVVDDGSTDRTREIVDGYKTQGVSYHFQENSGAGAARNLGIERCTGDFVAFLDADDAWLEDKNRLQAEYLAAHPRSRIGERAVSLVERAKGYARSSAAGFPPA